MLSRKERRKLARQGLPIEPQEEVKVKYSFRDYVFFSICFLPLFLLGFLVVSSVEASDNIISVSQQIEEARTDDRYKESLQKAEIAKAEYEASKNTADGEDPSDYGLMEGDFIGSVEAGNTQTTNYKYDGNGNLIKDNNFSYRYDAFNQLVEVKDITDDEVLVSYAYDVNGMMVVRNTPDVKTSYIYSPFNKQLISSVTTFYPSKRQEHRDYIYGSEGIDDPIQMVIDEKKNYFFTKDVQGSIRTVTDDSGKVVEQYSYSAYGETKIYNGTGAEISSSQIGNEFMFTGQRWDDVTKRYYYKARFYDPYTARFIQVDPSGYVDSYNPYNYVANDPINNIDPTGEILTNIVGAGTSIGINAALATALGQEYNGIDALIDGSLGFVTSGLGAAGQLKNLKKISDLQRRMLTYGTNAAHLGLDVAADYAHLQNQTSKSGGLPEQDFDLTESILYSAIGLPIAGTSQIDNQLGGISDWFGTRKKVSDAINATTKIAGFSTTEHLIKQMGERNISIEQIGKAINAGESFLYNQNNLKHKGFYDKNNNIFVAVGLDSNNIVTVIKPKSGYKYIENLMQRK